MSDHQNTTPGTGTACQCADNNPPRSHAGHCCLTSYPPEPYTGPLTCGHDDDFMARATTTEAAR